MKVFKILFMNMKLVIFKLESKGIVKEVLSKIYEDILSKLLLLYKSLGVVWFYFREDCDYVGLIWGKIIFIRVEKESIVEILDFGYIFVKNVNVLVNGVCYIIDINLFL